MIARPLTDLVDPAWAGALAPVEPRIHEIGEFLREEVAAGRTILSFEGDSTVEFFEGNYSDFERLKKERLGDVTPRRPKFKNVINR